jgi:hypothetical protein
VPGSEKDISLKSYYIIIRKKLGHKFGREGRIRHIGLLSITIMFPCKLLLLLFCINPDGDIRNQGAANLRRDTSVFLAQCLFISFSFSF